METVLNNDVHECRGIKAWATESTFVVAAIAFPAVCHALGWNVFALLPMHWTVLLSGLVFGPAAGFVAGICVPVANAVLSGMPAVSMLPLIALECALYGAVPGLVKKYLRGNSPVALAAGLIAGRLGFLAFAFALGMVKTPIVEFARAAFLPGAAAAFVQLAALPFAAYGVSRALGSADRTN